MCVCVSNCKQADIQFMDDINDCYQGRKSMFKHGGDNIGVNIHPACGMYRGARSAALL